MWKMSRLTSVHSRPSAAAQMTCWVSRFPIVARLWRELLNELLGSCHLEFRDRDAAGRRSPDEYLATTPSAGSEPNVGDPYSALMTVAPGIPAPQPGTHAAGPVPPAGRTLSTKPRAHRSERRRSNHALDRTNKRFRVRVLGEG